MYQSKDEELKQQGAVITTREIQQEPDLWEEAFANFKSQQSKINMFLKAVVNSTDQNVRVIFTGAGSSAYVGDTVVPYLTEHGDRSKFRFEAIDTTKIVSAPLQYLEPKTPTILVSFARSGNSPESVATVDLAEKLIDNLWQLTITCAPEGALAKHAKNDDHNLVLLQPSRSNDKGFAMTGSFSCMMLTALLTFDTASTEEKSGYIVDISRMGREVLAREDELQAIVNQDFSRIIYLGSGSLSGLTREAQLKVLELTAGQKATMFDSSMGFRHGPKSFVNDQTLVFDFMSNEAYTRQYDVDILEEVHHDQIAPVVMGVTAKNAQMFSGDNFAYSTGDATIPDAYMAFPDIMFAQTIALMASLKVGNTPDTPSATGTVNRVVKGVTIHNFD